MIEAKQITNERVDDLPLLLAIVMKSGIVEVLNAHLPHHGNWKGLLMGQIVAVWLTYILSMGDHRKVYVEEWVGEREETLSRCLGVEVSAQDFTDDRLGAVLTHLSDDEAWSGCERGIAQQMIGVYNLKPEVIRLDTTTVSSYGRVTEDGLLQFGHSKDHRPDLGQVKIASGTLDPLGMPIVTIPVSGEQSDDRLYVPLIEQTRSLLGVSGLLYVGDVKMSALAIRAELAREEDRYITPLPRTAANQAWLRDALVANPRLPSGKTGDKREESTPEWVQWIEENEKGESIVTAEGFVVTVPMEWEGTNDNGVSDVVSWDEYRHVVYSPAHGKRQKEQFKHGLAMCQEGLNQLVKRRRGYSYPQTEAELAERIEHLLDTMGMSLFVTVAMTKTVTEKEIRPYKDRPTRIDKRVDFALTITLNQAEIDAAHAMMGWRLYATNETVEHLPFTKLVSVYRNGWRHEHGYSRLKNKPLALSPLYLQKEAQIIGLIRLLSIALQLLTLIEYTVRTQLAKQDVALSGIYAGNPKRKSRRPRTETLLYPFRNITLTIIGTGEGKVRHRFLTPLTELQIQILHLLGLDTSIYTKLVLTKSD